MPEIIQNTKGPSATEKNILGTASILFSEKGFDAVSMRMIAAQAGVSKANIFHHFGSKESLYLAVLREAIQHSSHSLNSTEHSESTVLKALSAFSAQHLEVMLDNPDRSRLIMREALNSQTDRNEKLANEVVGESFSKLTALLQKGQSSGELKTNFDPAVAAALFVAADVFFFQAAPILKQLPNASFADDPDYYTQELLKIFLHGIASKAQ
jgi:TetR/AcrR family transcriptional regulator